VCIKHFGAASQGASCTARAVLREVIDGRKFRFDVSVSDGDREIGAGTHERRMPRGVGGDDDAGIPEPPPESS
jgi:predicted thioesterase